jgi:hypothetical protein
MVQKELFSLDFHKIETNRFPGVAKEEAKVWMVIFPEMEGAKNQNFAVPMTN